MRKFIVKIGEKEYVEEVSDKRLKELQTVIKNIGEELKKHNLTVIEATIVFDLLRKSYLVGLKKERELVFSGVN